MADRSFALSRAVGIWLRLVAVESIHGVRSSHLIFRSGSFDVSNVEQQPEALLLQKGVGEPRSVLFRDSLALFKMTVRRLHRAVVQALYEMDELHVRLDVRAAGSDIIGFERLRRHHFAKLVAEPVLNGHRE